MEWGRHLFLSLVFPARKAQTVSVSRARFECTGLNVQSIIRTLNWVNPYRNRSLAPCSPATKPVDPACGERMLLQPLQTFVLLCVQTAAGKRSESLGLLPHPAAGPHRLGLFLPQEEPLGCGSEERSSRSCHRRWSVRQQGLGSAPESRLSPGEGKQPFSRDSLTLTKTRP